MLFRTPVVLLLLWALAGTVAAQTAQPGLGSLPPGEYVIGGLEVKGTQFTSPATVLTLSGMRVGDAITIPGDALANALRNLWKQNLFADLNITAENVVDNKLFLAINVTERPRIARYTFTGITKSQADDLREQIKFTRGQRFTESKRRFAERIIRNYYHEKGFLNVKTTITEEKDPETPNGLLITIHVAKGKRVKVDEIVLNGVTELKPAKVKKQLKETKEARFWRLWKRSKYIPALFEEDKQKLNDYLLSRGYRDARVVADSVVNVRDNRVRLYLDVYQGRQYYFRNITWVGNFKYSSGRLDTLLGIRNGDVYNRSLLDRRLNQDPNGTDVASLYLDDGYLFYRLEPVEVRVQGDSIDLEMRMYEGPQANYNRIIIEGNDKTSDHVILRQVRTLPGEKFSRQDIIRSQREILALGYFNQENIQVVPLPNPEDGTVDIKYVVEEKPSDQLFFQGGWGGRVRDAQGNTISNGIVATVGLQFNNFSTRKMLQKDAWRPLPTGDGQKLGIQVQLNGRGFQNYRLSFQEPWLGGKRPTSLGASVYYSLQRSFVSDFRLNIIGASLDLGRTLYWPDDYFRSYTSLNYRYYDLNDPSESIISEVGRGFVNILSLKQTFERNSLNAPIYPTSGSYFSISVEATPPWNLFRNEPLTQSEDPSRRYNLLEFHKWKLEAYSFTRLFGNFVVMPRVQMGFLGFYDENLGLSPFERFYLGGDGLFGFALDGREIVALRGYRYPVLGDGTNGNAIYNKLTLELRQPISLQPSATVWLHAFAEAGNAWKRFEDYNPFQLYRSVGGGVRIFLPIFGLLGVDFGYGFDEVPGQAANTNGPNFHFMIGQQF